MSWEDTAWLGERESKQNFEIFQRREVLFWFILLIMLYLFMTLYVPKISHCILWRSLWLMYFLIIHFLIESFQSLVTRKRCRCYSSRKWLVPVSEILNWLVHYVRERTICYASSPPLGRAIRATSQSVSNKQIIPQGSVSSS